jgi:cytochrome c oxidase subunit 2
VRKSLFVQLTVLGVVIGGLSALVAILIPWLPDLGSKEGERIDDLYWLTIVICLVIFAIVAAVSIYAVAKFRAKPDDDEDGKPVHGHTGLEIFWTAIPAALVTVIAIYSGIVLVKNEDLQSGHRVIEVKAVQFAWSFTYPDIGVTTGVLRVPVGEQVEFMLRSPDVIHAFWVPEWRLKQDVVPGTTQHVIVTPNEVGTFPLVCTELCGIGHSTMRAQVEVLSREDYDAWVAEQQGAAQEGGATEGAAVFENAGCSGCHTLAAAGSTAQVGPDLDKVLVGRDAEFVRQSIVDPDAVVAEGYQPGVMPKDFGDRLSQEQLDGLVEYLLASVGG